MKNRKIIYLTVGIMFICYIVAAYYVRKQNDVKYAKAELCIENENYEEAVIILEDLGDYMDAKSILKDTKRKANVKKTYELGNKYMENGEYLKAIKKYEGTIEYKNSAEKVKEASYFLALRYMNESEYNKAKEYFIKAGDYEDSTLYLSKLEVQTAEKAKETIYEEALQKYTKNEFENAIELFEMIRGYKDSVEKAEECKEILRRMDRDVFVQN